MTYPDVNLAIFDYSVPNRRSKRVPLQVEIGATQTQDELVDRAVDLLNAHNTIHEGEADPSVVVTISVFVFNDMLTSQ